MTRDMCFLGRRTHITRISVFQMGEHILPGIPFPGGGDIFLGICVSNLGNTYQ